MRRWSSLVVGALVAFTGLVSVAVAGPGPGVADEFGLVDPTTGVWHLYVDGVQVRQFYFGNPGDYPFMGDWDCDGVETPGLYRQSDGYVYLRNENTQGVADVSFFFGNPGDVPLAGDFDGDGCDTVSIYRPSNQTFYIINALGTNDGGLGAAQYSFMFGNPGDKPFVGDFDGDGIDTVGLHRESTGLVYYRNSNTTGIADAEFIYGDPGDRFVAGDWTGNGVDSPGVYRPSNTTMYLRYVNSQGVADEAWVTGNASWIPVAGYFNISAPPPTTTSTTTVPPTTTSTTTTVPPTTTTSTTTTTVPGPCGATVTSSGDASGGSGQLREAITNVCDGGTITIFPTTITLSRGQLVIPSGKTMTIVADSGAGATIDGDANDRVMLVGSGAHVTLENLEITGGKALSGQSGAGIRNEGTLVVDSCEIVGNDAHTYSGGGISNAGDLYLTNSVVQGNSSSRGGGILNTSTGTMTITGGEIIDNTAGSKLGGGINNEGSMTIDGTTIIDNRAFIGGGIHNSGSMTVTDAYFSGNSSYRGAGAYNAGSGILRLRGDTAISGSVFTAYGGGVSNAGTLTMYDSASISGNAAESGGGIENTGSVEMLGSSSVTDNEVTFASLADGRGGGVYNSGTFVLDGTASITYNVSARNGAGVYNAASGTLSVRGSTWITYNSAGSPGGGVYNLGTTSVLSGATVTNNKPDNCNGC